MADAASRGFRQRPAARVGLARTPEVRRAAQALRWRVFAEELGARLPSRVPGIDEDAFDAHCEHLIARDDDSGEVIGTYRLLAPEEAAAAAKPSRKRADLGAPLLSRFFRHELAHHR